MKKISILLGVLILLGIIGLIWAMFYKTDAAMSPEMDKAIEKAVSSELELAIEKGLHKEEGHKVYKVEKNLLGDYFVYTLTNYGLYTKAKKIKMGAVVYRLYKMKKISDKEYEVTGITEPLEGEEYEKYLYGNTLTPDQIFHKHDNSIKEVEQKLKRID